MSQIPTYTDWMKSTHSLVRPRSDFLKAVDEALKSYDATKSAPHKQALKTALDRWRFEQSKKGQDWKKSVRNQNGAVTNLHRALSDLDKRNLTEAELEAIRYISDMQATALKRQFQGKELRFKTKTLVGLVQNADTNWKKFKSGAASAKGGYDQGKDAVSTAKQIKTGAQVVQQGGRAGAFQAARTGVADQLGSVKLQIRKLCSTLCDDLDPQTVFTALRLPQIEQFAADVAPFVGAVSAGGKAIAGWIGVAKLHWDKSNVKEVRPAIASGDPAAAFDALLVLIDREIVSSTARATTSSAAFSGKVLGSFLDAGAVTGPVIGLLEALAELFQTIVEYVRDYKECQEANKLLRAGELNLKLFGTSPLLGCYFLVIQDHSTIINFAVKDYGTPNWQFDVELLVGKVQLVLDRSGQYIRSARLEIQGMEKAKGIVEENYSVKTGISKVTGLKEHVQKSIMQRIDDYFEKPTKPTVDKSRIVGFGSDGGSGFGSKGK